MYVKGNYRNDYIAKYRLTNILFIQSIYVFLAIIIQFVYEIRYDEL